MTLFTRRFPTIVGLVVLLMGVGFGIWFVNSKKSEQGLTEAKPINVRITNVADNKFTISWTTTTATSGQVIYGKVSEKIATKVADDRDNLGSILGSYLTHHITIKDIQPMTGYAFRIISGEGNTPYDNNGSPYTVTTGPTIATTPPAETIYGQIREVSTLPAEGAIVYISIPGAAPTSTLVKSSGSYTVPVSILRSTDLTKYVTYDPTATVVTVTVDSGKQQASAIVSTANSAPVPTMTLGQTYDFRATSNVIAEVNTPTATPSAAPIDVLVVEPLGAGTTTTSEIVILTNPAENGEVVATLRPEISGTGPKTTVLSLVLQGPTKIYKDSIAIENDGTWSWTPTVDLVKGSHTITVSYLDTKGIEKSITRTITIETSATTPAFVATPSATTTIASPRVAIPSTESGVPVTGAFETTLLTGALGTFIIIVGAILLAL